MVCRLSRSVFVNDLLHTVPEKTFVDRAALGARVKHNCVFITCRFANERTNYRTERSATANLGTGGRTDGDVASGVVLFSRGI